MFHHCKLSLNTICTMKCFSSYCIVDCRQQTYQLFFIVIFWLYSLFLQTAFAVSIFFQFSFLLQRETTSSIRAFHTSVIFSRIFSSCSSACLLPQQLAAFWGSRDMMVLDFWKVCFKVLWKLYKEVPSKTLPIFDFEFYSFSSNNMIKMVFD